MAQSTGKKNTVLHQPQLEQEQLQLVTDLEDFLGLLETAVYEESAIENFVVRGITLLETDCSGVSFRHVMFLNCRFVSCQFDKGSFRNVIVSNCDLSNCSFRDSYWDCCTLQEVKGNGTIWISSSLHHFVFTGCQMRYANFSGALLELVRFERCGLQEAGFSSCQHKKQPCQWEQCDLTRADFFRTLLKEVDLSTCQMEGILLSDDYHELQGLTVNSLQAAELAKLLGVIVK